MIDKPRILLVPKAPVWIDPPVDSIAVYSGQPGEGFPTRELMLDFTHLVTGPVSGRVSSDVLMQAAAGVQGPTGCMLPLEGYDVAELDGAAGSNVLPARILRGMVLIANTRPNPSQEAPPFPRFRILLTQDRIGRPIDAFVLPALIEGVGDSAQTPSATSDAKPISQWPNRSPDWQAHLAGVAQIDDDLEASHTIAQSIEGHPDGDYWHAIMHRREPDYANSKYWFRHVGRHPVFAQLAPRAAQILQEAPAEVRSRWGKRLKVDARWDPLAFVDMCEAAAGDENSDLGMAARRIQWGEMLLLLRHTAQLIREP